MMRREEFEQLVEAFADYEGERAAALKFLIALCCDLQIALDQITCAEYCESLARAREIAGKALNQ